jgi:hypothetical protein
MHSLLLGTGKWWLETAETEALPGSSMWTRVKAFFAIVKIALHL